MHSGTGWDRAREVFLDVVDEPEAEREAVLARLAEEDPAAAQLVRRLLRFDIPPCPERSVPRRFGPYEVTRRIGAGGMGEVFIGRRADGEYEREVAIKLLRPDTVHDALVQRFLRERQTLASLDHEYIARLLDGGTSERGEPYLVMEYVDGEPADVFAARLGIRERLQLFLRIGQAVAHAHERGVIHRDLKPSNILVRTDGTPRLLDFGIARTRRREDDTELTRTGHRLFTPEYASPEQIRGEAATTGSDIFALGVLLHVFLVGRSPWPPHRSLGELERSICETDPPAPSRSLEGIARRRIAGDLDAITLQCLARRPDRRFSTVGELCEDIERHLAGLPIVARRTGALTRATRYARRRPAHLVAGVLATLALAALSLWIHAQGRDQLRQDELRTAVSDRIEGARSEWADGRSEEAYAELDAADAALEALPDAAALRAESLAQRAVFLSLERSWKESVALAERALRELDAVADPDAAVKAKALNTLAYATHRMDPSRSEAHSRTALQHVRAHLDPGDVLHADALLGWSDELRHRGRDDEARRLLDEAVAEIRSRDPRSEIAARFLNEQAVAFARSGQLEVAAGRYRDALEILSWHRGERNPSVGKVRFNLAATLYRADDLEGARREFERTLPTWEAAGDEWFRATTHHRLGIIHLREQRLEAAEAAAREALEIRTRIGDESMTARSRCLVALVRAARGERAEVGDSLRRILDSRERDGLPAELEALARTALGRMLIEETRRDDGRRDHQLQAKARAHLEAALVILRELRGPTHADSVAVEELLRALR